MAVAMPAVAIAAAVLVLWANGEEILRNHQCDSIVVSEHSHGWRRGGAGRQASVEVEKLKIAWKAAGVHQSIAIINHY